MSIITWYSTFIMLCGCTSYYYGIEIILIRWLLKHAFGTSACRSFGFHPWRMAWPPSKSFLRAWCVCVCVCVCAHVRVCVREKHAGGIFKHIQKKAKLKRSNSHHEITFIIVQYLISCWLCIKFSCSSARCTSSGVSEKCLLCGVDIPLERLPRHL